MAILNGSLAMSPNGVTLPMASPARYAVNIDRSARWSSGSRHKRHAAVRTRARTPPNTTTMTIPPPTRLKPSTTAVVPACRMDQANSMAPHSAASRLAPRRRRSVRHACNRPIPAKPCSIRYDIGFGRCLDLVRDDKRRPISAVPAGQQTIGLFVADHPFPVRIHAQRPAQAIGSIRQMDQRAGDVSLLDGGVQFLLLSAAHALDEIGEVIVVRMTAGTRLPVAAQPALVAEVVFVARSEVSVRSVKNVANGIVAVGQTAVDAGFIVRDPMPNLDLHHLATTVRLVEFEDAVERVRCFLVVIEHDVAADRGHAVGERDAETPACGIHLVDGLVAEIPVACVPDPVPVVMEAIACERFQGCGAGPEVVVDPGWSGFGRRPANRVAPFEAQCPCQIDLAKGASAQVMDGVDQGRRRAALRAVLHDAAVLLRRTNHLASLPQVV